MQRGDGQAMPVDTDPHGRFTAAVPGGGPLRLRCLPAGAPHPVVTDWFTA